MSEPSESTREKYNRYAQECIELVKHSSDPIIRTTFIAMASAWLSLAKEIVPELGRGPLGR